MERYANTWLGTEASPNKGIIFHKDAWLGSGALWSWWCSCVHRESILKHSWCFPWIHSNVFTKNVCVCRAGVPQHDSVSLLAGTVLCFIESLQMFIPLMTMFCFDYSLGPNVIKVLLLIGLPSSFWCSKFTTYYHFIFFIRHCASPCDGWHFSCYAIPNISFGFTITISCSNIFFLCDCCCRFFNTTCSIVWPPNW